MDLGELRIWLDDERAPKDWLPHTRWFRDRDPSELLEWVWVRTVPDAIELLEAGGIAELSLDHDLGEEGEGDGYDVLLWIEERVAADESYVPPVIHIHSSNVVARQRMESAAASIERIVAKRKS